MKFLEFGKLGNSDKEFSEAVSYENPVGSNASIRLQKLFHALMSVSRNVSWFDLGQFLKYVNFLKVVGAVSVECLCKTSQSHSFVLQKLHSNFCIYLWLRTKPSQVQNHIPVKGTFSERAHQLMKAVFL